MRSKSISICIALVMGALFCRPFAPAQSPAIDPAVAHQYFQEARSACAQDGGKLWGISVCGPILFVDPATRTVVANQSDLQGLLTRKDEVFVGRLPDKQPIANAPVTWAGVK